MVGLLNHYSLQPIYKDTKVYISSSNFQKRYYLTLFSLNLLDKIMLQQKGSEPFLIKWIGPQQQAYPFQVDKGLVDFRVTFHRMHSYPNFRVMNF